MFRKLLISILMVCLIGCGPLRQTKLDLANEEAMCVETGREVSEILKDNWLWILGVVRGAINTDQLSAETVKAMEESEQLAKKEELTDYELGYFLGLRIRIINSVSMQVLQQYAPEVFELLPLVL